ncbi:MAG: thiamine phosphate synthase [Fibrobacter sp.]|uniref:thiamine phosphate synthase n=1 Tax=Fibrobacter sp. TaxID=35828 RepID=UPI0025B8C975|nr:thiamine phosphate synthase [Fibrobacter sp.]MBR4785766.1 thiamine phosphate synthase [Fibrobacter sp.]
MRLWLSTCLDNFSSEFDDIEEMFKRGLTRLILQKRGRGGAPSASESEYDRWLLSLPLEYRDRIWVRGTPDMAERLEVRGCVVDAGVLAGDVPERWKRIDCVVICRDPEELVNLPEWVSAVLVGPVYQPQSALESVKTLGAQSFARIFENANENLPRVIAFGGIDHENLDEFKKLPLQGISVLGGIWNYADPVNAFIKLGRACNN